MKQTTTTTAAAIAPILQSYINVCGITQYVEPTARDFSVVEKIKCDLRICNLLSGAKRHGYDGRGYIVSDAKYYDLRFPERERVLIFCDMQNAARKIFDVECVWGWCEHLAAAGHIVAIKHFAAPSRFIEVWHNADGTEKLFIFGGGKYAENTRS